MKAVFLDYATMGPDLDISSILELLPALQVFEVTEDHEIAERITGAEFVLGNKVRISDKLIQGNPELRFVGLTATGTDNVDLVAARRRNVAVCNIRGYCTQSVAEHVFGCLLNLTHNLGRYRSAVRAGEWQRSDEFCLSSYPIRELSSMTLGIVGYGELGKGVADVANHFGMEVIVAARPGSNDITDDRVSFDDLLRLSDVISLHCPLNENTEGLFGAEEFSRMKPDAILINTARGALVDSAALSTALKNGEIAAAAIDVLAKEPPVDGDPLLDYDGPNLILTPHIAWATNEARQAAIDELAKNIAAFLSGQERNRVA